MARSIPMEISICKWCKEFVGDGGPDPLGDPWCVRCRDAEMACQETRRQELLLLSP